MSANETLQHPVILFDGVCNLCSHSVQFVIKRDKKDVFRFASLQSETGQSILNAFNLPAAHLSSFVLVEDNKVYTRSTGALRVSRKLSGVWSMLYAFIIIPAFIRNGIYNFIAANRYRWFGKQEACWLPSPELKKKFI